MSFSQELTAHVVALTSSMRAQEFCAEAQRRGIPAAPVNSLADTLRDHHLEAIGYWDDRVDAEGRTVRWPGAPFTLHAVTRE